MTDQIQFYATDILGIQEGLLHQIEYIKKTLKLYEFLGVGRDDGGQDGEFCTTFYNKKQRINGKATVSLTKFQKCITGRYVHLRYLLITIFTHQC